jgi:flagellar biosynthesis chaperone FliJ
MESEGELAGKKAELEVKRARLAEAWKRLRAIEKLRDKQWARHCEEVRREERTVGDEVAVNLYVRRSGCQPSEVIP